MKIDADGEATAEGEAMFAYALLVTGFSQSPEMAIVTMVVAVIAQLPLRIQIQIITQPAIEAYLYDVNTQGEPIGPSGRLDKKPSSPEGKRSVILRSELLVFRGKIPVERNDIPMQTNIPAYQK